MPVNSFKWKHYAGEIILLNVRWYLKYALSYRNLQEMMAERGVEVDHTTAIPVLNKNTCGRRLNFLIFRNNFISLSTCIEYES